MPDDTARDRPNIEAARAAVDWTWKRLDKMAAKAMERRMTNAAFFGAMLLWCRHHITEAGVDFLGLVTDLDRVETRAEQRAPAQDGSRGED